MHGHPAMEMMATELQDALRIVGADHHIGDVGHFRPIRLRSQLVLIKKLKRRLALVCRPKSCLVTTPSLVLRQDRIRAGEVVRVHANTVV